MGGCGGAAADSGRQLPRAAELTGGRAASGGVTCGGTASGVVTGVGAASGGVTGGGKARWGMWVRAAVGGRQLPRATELTPTTTQLACSVDLMMTCGPLRRILVTVGEFRGACRRIHGDEVRTLCRPLRRGDSGTIKLMAVRSARYAGRIAAEVLAVEGFFSVA